MSGETSVHGVALVLGEAGVLIRGPAGSGKTSLALDLIARTGADGGFARLVADDRVILRERGGRLLARPHPEIAGRAEIRGVGIVEAPYLPEARLRLVVDLDPRAPRAPDDADMTTTLENVAIPWLVLQREIAIMAILRFFGAFFSPLRLE
ncbi:MAG: serine kinase [Salinarimonadaceae bacterium]|nr:MAG: serine kinase [Salinarimonadaceae bacterium]